MRLKVWLMISMVFFGSLLAKQANHEKGAVAIKLKEGYVYNGSSMSVGIPEVDAMLAKLHIKSVAPRFKMYKSKGGNLSRILKLSFDESLDPIGVCNALRNNPYLEYVEPIYIDEVLETPNDTHFAASLNLAVMQAEAAWEIHKCENGSEPIIIGIVDTGAVWKHPDLAHNIWNNIGEDANLNGYTMYHNGTTWVMDPGDLNGIDDDANGYIDDLIGWNFMLNANGDENNDPLDVASHGTRVSGLAGARTNNSIGVSSLSWNPIILPISCAHSGATSTISKGYDGILYAAENGAKIINCSWGGSTYSSVNRDVIAHVDSMGVIVVAAAGNSNNTTPVYPSAYPKVISTAALNNNGSKFSSSSYGGFVDVGAPNEVSYTTTSSSGYIALTGYTSYASPIAAALTALIRSYHPDWTNEQVRTQLKNTCDNVNSVNPGKEYLLGEGRLNAYRALAEENPAGDPKLHLRFFQQLVHNDGNSNKAIEQGESFSMNLVIRNFSDYTSNGDATFVLSTTNPAVTITQNTHYQAIPADDWFTLENAFSVIVDEDASSQYVSFSLAISNSVPIRSGSTMSFNVLIQAGGVFVWEGVAGARNHSGTFIRDTLSAMGKQVTYGTTYPASFLGFDAVFLSFGAVDTNIKRLDTPEMFYAIKDYLTAGGKLYIEGADAVAYDLATKFPMIENGQDGDEIIWPLLGIFSGTDGGTNAISSLQGQASSLAEGINFGSTNQTNVTWIDTFSPDPLTGKVVFIEDNYGNVGISGSGVYGQKSMVFSYALAELADGASPNTRADLVKELVRYFLDKPILEIAEIGGEHVLLWDKVPLASTYDVLFADVVDGEYSILQAGLTDTSLIVDTTEQHRFYKVIAMP